MKDDNNDFEFSKVHVTRIISSLPDEVDKPEEKKIETNDNSDNNKEVISVTKIDKLVNEIKDSSSEILELPKINPAKINTSSVESIKKVEKIEDKPMLSNTILLKLNEIKAGIKKEEKKEENTSLYNTVVIKLEEIIKKNNSLEINNKVKVTDVSSTNKKMKYSVLPIIGLGNNIHVNIDDESYGKYLYKLNKIAIRNLTKQTHLRVNKTRLGKQSKLLNIDNVHVSKKNYQKYQDRLNKFAINKLYYKFAPKESNKYKLYKLCLTFSICIFLFTSLVIGNWFKQGYSIKRIEENLRESTEIVKVDDGTLYNVDTNEDDKIDINKYGTQYWKYLKTPLSSVDFGDLLKENSDTVGWIIINNTNINYPIVQTNNNDFYLNHAFDKTSNNAGWIYADFRDNFNRFNKNLVIYGHGRKDKIMFGSLTNSLNKSWYTQEDNQIIQLSTLKYNTMWQIFSIYTIEAENYYITTDFEDNNSYGKFLNDMLSRSIYNFGVKLSTEDKIITLSTCYNDNGVRLVVQAKLVKIQER